MSDKGSGQRGANGGEGDSEQHGRPQRESDGGDTHPHGPLVEHEMLVLTEGLCYHKGRKERGREQSDHRERAWR